jgi:cytochrome P450
MQKTANPADVIPMLLNMDPPEHRDFREMTHRHFTPRALTALQAQVDRVAQETVARVAKRAADPARRGEPFDFVSEIAAPFPLGIIAELMAFPEADRAQLFEWSNAIIGIEDPDYGDADDLFGSVERAQLGLFKYFSQHLAQRRRRPGNDLVSVIAHARIAGRPLSHLHELAYCFLMLLAGNETTRNAISGGMAALIEHPDEMRRLRDDPSLLETAADEIVRWTSPIIYFLRTAACDVEVGGERIAAGDRLALYYPSANRDPDAICDPERFDVARRPNRHLGFGIGEHVCLGAHLARMEIRAAFREVLSQLPDLELAGPIARVHSDFVGGVKRLPVRFSS